METLEQLEEQLASVRKSIKNIEDGAQEYGLNGRRVVRADLKTLYDREERLLSRVETLKYGNVVNAHLVRWEDA